MEAEFLGWLRERLPEAKSPIEVGVGDDGAVIASDGSSRIVVTTDMLSDGVDFRLGEVDPRRIGRKALAVNLSDLAAMAAQPIATFVSLLLPRNGGAALARELYEGLLPLAEEFSAPVVGGDTNAWDGALAISITVIGRAGRHGLFLRGGARPGDAIVVTGTFGGSILSHQFDFTPRVREALWLAQHAKVHAAMDVSDGLTLDLSRLCAESGCGADLALGRIPVSSDAVRLADTSQIPATPLSHALNDGEDFELLLAINSDDAARLVAEQPLEPLFGVRLTQIGRFVAEHGLWVVDAMGNRLPLEPGGFQHRFD